MTAAVDLLAALAGQPVDIVRWDYGLRFWTRDNWEVLLAGDIEVSAPDGQVGLVDTAAPDNRLPASLEGLEDQFIGQVVTGPDGTVSIPVGERRLTVAAGEDFEAWQVMGPAGQRVICMPGGGLAVFS